MARQWRKTRQRAGDLARFDALGFDLAWASQSEATRHKAGMLGEELSRLLFSATNPHATIKEHPQSPQLVRARLARLRRGLLEAGILLAELDAALSVTETADGAIHSRSAF